MRYAVLAITAKGIEKAAQVAAVLAAEGHSVQAYFKAGRLQEASGADAILNGKVQLSEYTRLSNIMDGVFHANYDGLIFIMATGIVVRSIAPYIVSKLSDPAILVMDEAGRHVISLLSGHIGGANALTVYLAERLHSDPVITTATDVNNMLAPDALAQRLELLPYPKAAIEVFNSGLLAGKKVEYILDADIKCIAEYKRRLNLLGVDYRICHITQQADIAGTSVISAHMDEVSKTVMNSDYMSAYGCKKNLSVDEADNKLVNTYNTVDVNAMDYLTVVIINHKKLMKNCKYSAQSCDMDSSQIGANSGGGVNSFKKGFLPLRKNLLYLYPRRLAAGIGCKRYTPVELIESAVEKACQKIGWPVERIDLLASTVVKQEEKGLLDFAAAINRKITFYENDKLQEVIDRYKVEESAFVKKTIGIGNVSEAAALACFERARVALPKTKYERVTVSLVWEK